MAGKPAEVAIHIKYIDFVKENLHPAKSSAIFHTIKKIGILQWFPFLNNNKNY